ncbi:MAPEG family protein [Litorimonas sp. RW-G-Af-16]|uniref:MAPEG family protein n=1 Tax=Litorimonas sp. RW-G-Af-16 TaxID=3241168 RepID=UPI00390C592A
MTLFQIVALYVALNLILAIILTLRVGLVRVKGRISLGDGGDQTLLSRIRAHGNFTESAPLALIGLMALAMMGASPLLLHIFGAGFLLGRVLHALGMAGKNAVGPTRAPGMMLTLAALLGTALTLLYLVFTFEIM